MLLDVPPGFPVSFNVFASGDTLFLSMFCGNRSTQVFWHAGSWHGPGVVEGENLAFRIGRGVRALWPRVLPHEVVESLVRQLRDPASVLVGLDVMES